MGRSFASSATVFLATSVEDRGAVRTRKEKVYTALSTRALHSRVAK
jgi:hypothetical protein